MRNIKKKFGQQTIGGGGGGAAPSYNVWLLESGKTLSPSAAVGVRKIVTPDITTITIAEIVDLVEPGVLPSGVGVAINLVSGARSLVHMGISPVHHDIWLGQSFIAYETIQIKITGTGTDPITNPERFQSFLIPLFVN